MAARLVGHVIRRLRRDLWFLPCQIECVPCRAAHEARRRIDPRRVRREVGLDAEREVVAEQIELDVGEQAAAPHALVLALIDPRDRILRLRGLGRNRDREAAIRFLLAAVLDVTNDRVLAGRLPGFFRRVVVEQAEVGGDVARHAGDLFVDLEMVVGAEVPQLVLDDRTADVGVTFPELDVRLAGIATGDLRRVAALVVADERLLLIREIVQHLHVVAAALDRVDHGSSGRVHLDVAARGLDRDFFVGEVVGVEARAAGAFSGVHAIVQNTGLVPDPEALVSRLLALVAAADVEAVHAHARRLAEHGPDIRRGRDADEFVGGEIRSHFRVLDVDDR